jgi:hypothetical protein
MDAAEQARTLLSFNHSRGAPHEPNEDKVGDVDERNAGLKRCGEGSLIGSISGDEWEYTEGHVHGKQSYDTVASCCPNGAVDGIEPFAEGKEEEEDGDMKENRNTIIQASHLELGKTVEEIGAHAASFVWCGTRLRILQVFAGPLLDESRDERASHAEKEAEEQEDVNTDG